MNKKLLTPLHFNFLCQRAYQEGTHITSDTHESAGDAHPLATNAQSIPALLQTKSLFFRVNRRRPSPCRQLRPTFQLNRRQQIPWSCPWPPQTAVRKLWLTWVIKTPPEAVNFSVRIQPSIIHATSLWVQVETLAFFKRCYSFPLKQDIAVVFPHWIGWITRILALKTSVCMCAQVCMWERAPPKHTCCLSVRAETHGISCACITATWEKWHQIKKNERGSHPPQEVSTSVGCLHMFAHNDENFWSFFTP